MGVMPVRQIRMPDFSSVSYDVTNDAIVELKGRLEKILSC